MSTNMAGLTTSDLSILYVLMAVLILLALVAAVGAWARGGGIKRDEAEGFFSDAAQRQQAEIQRLEALLAETRKANEEAMQALRNANDEAHITTRDVHNQATEAMASHLQEIDRQVQKSSSSIENAVTQASAEYTEALSDELELVVKKLNETDRRLTSGLSDLNSSLGQVQNQVTQAGESIRQALIEITRQQQEQKAQSTIQLCEALISSLGTLKSTIAGQLAHNSEPDAVQTDASVIDEFMGKLAPPAPATAAAPESKAAGERPHELDTIGAKTEEGDITYQPFTTREEFTPAPASEDGAASDEQADTGSSAEHDDGAENRESDSDAEGDTLPFPPPLPSLDNADSPDGEFVIDGDSLADASAPFGLQDEEPKENSGN